MPKKINGKRLKVVNNMPKGIYKRREKGKCHHDWKSAGHIKNKYFDRCSSCKIKRLKVDLLKT